MASPPSPPRRRVHAGTTPHKVRGGGSSDVSAVTSSNKENRLNSSAKNHRTEQDLPVRKKSPLPSSHNDDDDDNNSNSNNNNNDVSLSMVLSPDGSQLSPLLSSAAAAAGGGGGLVLDDDDLDLDLSGVSSITGGCTIGSGAAGGIAGTGKKKAAGHPRLSLSSAKSSGTGTGTASSSLHSNSLVGMNFLSPATTTTAAATPVPSGGRSTGGRVAAAKSGPKSGRDRSGGRRHSAATARSAASSLPSTPGFASPLERWSRPNFLLSPSAPTGSGNTPSRVESVLRVQQPAVNGDADTSNNCHNVETMAAERSDGARGCDAAAMDIDEREENAAHNDDVDNDDVDDESSPSSSLDEEMFLPNNAAASVDSSYHPDLDDDQDGTKDDSMEDTDGTPISLDNAPPIAPCTAESAASNQVGDEQGGGDGTDSTERVVSAGLEHDVPTIPEGVEDANSSSGDDMPLPDGDDGNVELGLTEDDVQSSPSRPAVLDHADIDPASSRISATTPAAAQNVLAELPTDTDPFAAALQKSAAKTPRALSKKNTTAAASSSPKVATPAPGLPFGEVRVGEAPIFSPLSFHGGAMATAASATTSSSASSNGMGRVRKARASVGGVSRSGRTSIGGAGRRRASFAPSAAVAAGDGIGILGMLGAAAPTCGKEPLVEHDDESGSNDCESKASTGSNEDASAPSTSEQNALEDSAADGAPLPLEVEPKEPANVADKSCDDDKVLASPESESTANENVAPEPSVAASLVQSPENLEERMNNDSVEEEDTPSSSTGSSDGDSNGSDDDETESEASSWSSSSDDVSIVLPNRKNKQGGQRRNIQASDEESDGSFQVGSSSDDAKDEDEDEDDVLVSDGDKGDDGSYTIESDEEDEDDDDVLIYESDESSVGAKPAKKAGASRKKNAKPKARARVIESEDDSDGSIESGSHSVASLERSMKAASIAASNSNDESIIQAEVVDDGESADDDDSAPSEETILRVADELFIAADKESITVRDICNSIEDRFGLTLEKPTKKVIKAHLIALINEEIQPIVGDTAGDNCSDKMPNDSVSGSLGELEDSPEPKNQRRRRGGLPSSSSAKPMSLETTLASAASNGGSTNSRSLGTRKGSVRRGKWSRGAQLGVGSFGVVHMGMNQRNGQMMAVKTMNMPEDDEDGLLSDLEGEVHVMRALNHSNIVRYIGCERDLKRSTLAIFQEWVPGGSISSLLRKFGPFPLPVIRKYLYQICTGLAYLHENGIIHRDIKGSNILVTDEGVCKLADFGASRRLRSSAGNSEGSEEQDDMEQSLTMRGTPYFMAPEVFEERYGTKSDIWSFGCVAFQMCSGLPPWKASGIRNPYDLIRLLKESEDVPELPKDIDSKLESLIRACFQRDPSLRPSAETLLQHRLFDVDECSTVFSGESSSFGVKSPSARNAARKAASSSASNHRGESSYHFPAEYDEKEWPKWAKNESEKSGESDVKNPFGRSRK